MTGLIVSWVVISKQLEIEYYVSHFYIQCLGADIWRFE